jgi:hypothetical protein
MRPDRVVVLPPSLDENLGLEQHVGDSRSGLVPRRAVETFRVPFFPGDRGSTYSVFTIRRLHANSAPPLVNTFTGLWRRIRTSRSCRATHPTA